MTLRARLLVAAIVVAGVLALVVLLVPRSVHEAQIRQIDAQLIGAAPVAGVRFGGRPPGPLPVQDNPFSDLYIATADADGSRHVIIPSRLAPGREPTLSATVVAGAPHLVTVGSSAGARGTWRVSVLSAPGVPSLVVAAPLDRVEATTTDVRWTLAAGASAVFAVLLLGGWWILRLGLRPIAEVTAVAGAIADGQRDRRASEAGTGTEATRLAHAVNTMLDQQIAAEDRLRTFVSDASHELRTPVAAIRGFTDLYRGGDLTEDGALDDAMRRIGQEARRMGVLVDDLLLLARLDEGRPLERSTVDVSALLADAALDASATHPSRTVTVDASPGMTVTGDEARLRQVVANLVTNALVHGGPDAEIAVSARSIDGVCAIDVADNGRGMDADGVTRAFDRFWRADPSRVRNRSGAGLGLGLSIVRAIVEAHGGRITLDSSPGAGTCVVVAIPSPPALAPGAPGAPDGGPPARPAG